MSIVAIIVIVVLVLVLLLFIGGALGARRHNQATEGRLHVRVQAADRALEAARAADRGWDKIRLEEAARAAIEMERPGFRYDALHLVLVDDRPGTDEDRARMAAVGSDDVVEVTLVRRGDAWIAESAA